MSLPTDLKELTASELEVMLNLITAGRVYMSQFDQEYQRLHEEEINQVRTIIRNAMIERQHNDTIKSN